MLISFFMPKVYFVPTTTETNSAVISTLLAFVLSIKNSLFNFKRFYTILCKKKIKNSISSIILGLEICSG